MFNLYPVMPYENKYIYHYTTIENLLLYILPQKRIRMSSINNTNDPQEMCNVNFSLSDDLNLGADSEADCMKNFLSNQSCFSDTIKKNVKVLCFAQDDMLLLNESFGFGKGFTKPRMWAQYSNNNKGACLIFNKNKFIDKLCHSYSKYFLRYGSIEYGSISYNLALNRRIYEANTLNTSEFNDLSIEEVASARIKEYADIYYFLKHPDWKEENEYRIIINYPDDDYAYIEIDGLLEGIVLGAKYDEQLLTPLKLNLKNYELLPKYVRIHFSKNNCSVLPCE